MAQHLDLQGNIHDDMDGAARHRLPIGCVSITNAEADAIRAKRTADGVAALPYGVKRASAYPPLANLADAMVKMEQLDPIVKADGLAQFKKYCAECMAVKSTIPKV